MRGQNVQRPCSDVDNFGPGRFMKNAYRQHDQTSIGIKPRVLVGIYPGDVRRGDGRSDDRQR
jgi:hypothetical protein